MCVGVDAAETGEPNSRPGSSAVWLGSFMPAARHLVGCDRCRALRIEESGGRIGAIQGSFAGLTSLYSHNNSEWHGFSILHTITLNGMGFPILLSFLSPHHSFSGSATRSAYKTASSP